MKTSYTILVTTLIIITSSIIRFLLQHNKKFYKVAQNHTSQNRAKAMLKILNSQKQEQPSKQIDRPVFHFVKHNLNQNVYYEKFQARQDLDVQQKEPIIIVPDVLGGTATNAVVRAALQFHLDSRDVYVLLDEGSNSQFANQKSDIFCSSEPLIQLIKHINKQVYIYCIGSGFLKVNCFVNLQSSTLTQVLSIFYAFPVSDIYQIQNENYNPSLIKVYTNRNQTIFKDDQKLPQTYTQLYESLNCNSQKLIGTNNTKYMFYLGEKTYFNTEYLKQKLQYVQVNHTQHMDHYLKNGTDYPSYAAMVYFNVSE